jgi:acetyl esterase/lipase
LADPSAPLASLKLRAVSVRDRIDPDLLEGLDAFLAASGPRGLAGIDDVAERRRVFAEMMAQAVTEEPPDDGVETDDRHVPGAAGAPKVLVRVYRPASPRPLPAVVYIHGGGMVIGSIETEDLIARMLARELPCVTVSVEYRLAPETRHPGPVEDCYAALKWLEESADGLGVDRDRIAVYGGSAGGNLAAGVALLARDRGGPRLAYQMLLYPMLDDRADTRSCAEINDIGIWDGWAHREGFEALLGEAARTDGVDHYAAPARARDLSGLPSTYIDVGELDALRDESVTYALALMRAGVRTELHVFPGAYHGWEIFAPDAAISARAVTTRLDALRRELKCESAAIGAF